MSMANSTTMLRVAGAACAVLLLASCEGAVERNTAKRLAPDAPAADAALRDQARAHSRAACAAGDVLITPDPERPTARAASS